MNKKIVLFSCLIMLGGNLVPVATAFADEMPIMASQTDNVESDVEILPDTDAPIFSDEGSDYLVIEPLELGEVESDSIGVDEVSPSSNARLVMPTVVSWKVSSKKAAGYSKGAWRNGPSGKGKATLTAKNSNTTKRTVTTTIKGSYPVGKGKIEASIGTKIDKTTTYSVSYKINIPKGKKQQIIFRPVYKLTKVNQRKYEKVGNITQATKIYKTATVSTFSNWEYSYKTIK